MSVIYTGDRYSGVVYNRPLKLTKQDWFEKNIVFKSKDVSPILGNFKTKYSPHYIKLFQLVDRLETKELFAKWSSQSGKAICLETPILRASGWTTMGDLKVGDVIFDEQGKPTKVLNKSKIHYKPTYRVTFDTGEHIDACEDHIWTVNKAIRKNRKEGRLRGYQKIDITTKELSKLRMTIGNSAKYSIPYTEPLMYDAKELPIAPYTLGVWLGDGHSSSSAVTINSLDTDIIDNIFADGYIIGKKHYKVGQTSCFTTRVGNTYHNDKGHVCNDFLEKLRDNNLLNNKHIPDIYLKGSLEQRTALFQGLMDTDGYRDVAFGGVCEFSSSIPKLAEGFIELLNGFGIKHSVVIRESSYNDAYGNKVDCKMSYRISFKGYSDLVCPFRTERKKSRLSSMKDSSAHRVYQVTHRYIRSVELIETVATQCIEVDSPSHLFLVGKGLIPTHNSLFGIGICAETLDQDPCTVIYAQPIKDDVPKILDLKINPVLKSMPTLWKKFEDFSNAEGFRTKDAIKRVAGGALLVSGSSVKERKSLTTPIIVADEIGEFEKGSITEFKERLKSFSRFRTLVVGLSTIVSPDDEICVNHDLCEVKIEWHFICKKCNNNFYPDGDYLKVMSKEEYAKKHNIPYDDIVQFKYVNEATQNAHVECPHCSHHIYEAERTDMILNGNCDWFINNQNGTYTRFAIEDLTTESTFGVNMNSLGSYFATLDIIAKSIIDAGDDPIKLDKFYRGWLNKFYEIKLPETNSNDLLYLSNGLPEWGIHPDTYKIYVGVDTQKDHFWIEVKAFRYNRISDTLFASRVETFGDIEDIWEYCQNLTDANGDYWIASKMGIDRRGYNQDGVRRTDEVDYFVSYMTKKWGEDRVYATEGHSKLTGDKSIQVVNSRDLSTNRNKVDIKILKLSDLYLKTLVRRGIDRGIYKVVGNSDHPDAYNYESDLFYINQDIVNAESDSVNRKSYTKQLTCEIYDYKINSKGVRDSEKSWFIPTSIGTEGKGDNHFFDTSVICYALAEMDNIGLAKKPSKYDIDDIVKIMDF